MNLHAVAPGGPPEGQCKKKQILGCYTTLDNTFRTRRCSSACPLDCDGWADDDIRMLRSVGNLQYLQLANAAMQWLKDPADVSARGLDIPAQVNAAIHVQRLRSIDDNGALHRCDLHEATCGHLTDTTHVAV